MTKGRKAFNGGDKRYVGIMMTRKTRARIGQHTQRGSSGNQNDGPGRDRSMEARRPQAKERAQPEVNMEQVLPYQDDRGIPVKVCGLCGAAEASYIHWSDDCPVIRAAWHKLGLEGGIDSLWRTQERIERILAMLTGEGTHDGCVLRMPRIQNTSPPEGLLRINISRSSFVSYSNARCKNAAVGKSQWTEGCKFGLGGRRLGGGAVLIILAC